MAVSCERGSPVLSMPRWVLIRCFFFRATRGLLAAEPPKIGYGIPSKHPVPLRIAYIKVLCFQPMDYPQNPCVARSVNPRTDLEARAPAPGSKP